MDEPHPLFETLADNEQEESAVETPLVQVQFNGRERKIARGQFTTVWEVTLDGITSYAGKKLRDSVRDRYSPDWAKSLESGLRRECQLLRQLVHPNVVLAVGLSLDDSSKPTLVMELMEDGNLDDYIGKRRGKMDEQLQHTVLLDVARGLQYIHSKGIVHYSLNSRKIFLTFKRPDIPMLAKIGGFGAAAMESRRPHIVLAEESEREAAGESTLATYPPEVFSGLDSHEATSLDVFSFGVVMLQTLTQENPLPLPLINEYGSVVPEVERRMKYFDMLEDEHPLKQTVIECLGNQPQYRPSAENILCIIGKAELRTFIPVDEVNKLIQHHQQALFRLRSEKDRSCSTADRLRQQLDELSAQHEAEGRALQQSLEQLQHLTVRQERELTILRDRLRFQDIPPGPSFSQIRRHTPERSQSAQEEVPAQSQTLAPAISHPVGEEPGRIPRNEVHILEEIGRGAWATVAKGKYRQATVAIKWPHEQLIKDYPNILPRLEREISIMAQLRHPNLIHFIGTVVVDGNSCQLQGQPPPLIVTELLDTNLRREYMRCKTQNVSLGKHVLQSIFLNVAYGLHCLHTHDPPIIHRDISAPNILLKRMGNGCWLAKISDFGSANLLPNAQTLGEGAIIYTAPEVFPRADGTEQPVQTPKIDIYSYGRMLCEVIAGELPTSDRYPHMLKTVLDKWDAMHRLIGRCTQHCPTARPTTVDIIDELNRIPRPPLRSQISV